MAIGCLVELCPNGEMPPVPAGGPYHNDHGPGSIVVWCGVMFEIARVMQGSA